MPEGSTVRTRVQNHSSRHVPAATARLQDTVPCHHRGSVPRHRTGELPPTSRGAAQARGCASLLPWGHRAERGTETQRLRGFLHRDAGSAVSWPLLTPLLRLAAGDRVDTALPGGGRSLGSVALVSTSTETLPSASFKCAAGKFKHGTDEKN